MTSIEAAPAITPASAEAERRMARRYRWATVFGWVRNIGLILMLFVAWQVWGTAIQEHHSQDSLRAAFEARATAPVRPQTPTLIPANTQLPNPAEGTVVARIEIPKIGVSQYVVSGTAAADLAMGPGHYAGTALPGQAGNVAIAGHRTTHGAPFYELNKLVVGDAIKLTTTTGQTFKYLVSQAPYSVSPRNVSVLDNFGDNRLTLTTCTPPFSAAQRLIVVSLLSAAGGQPAPHTPRVAPHRYHLAVVDNSGWGWGSLPLVFVAGAGLVALGLYNRRLAAWYGKVGRWLVLVPIWLAGMYLLFEGLAGFLPASV